MPKSEKNNERIKQVPRGRKKPTKIEPLRQTTEQPNKLYNDLAKFPSENPYPVLRIHKDGTVLYANKASEPLLKARDSAISKPAPAQWRRLAEDVLTTGQVAREEVKDNGRVFAFRVVPITGSDYVNFYGVDITERKKAEERVKTEHQRLYDVLETLPVMVCLLTPDYHVAFTNRVFRQKFGKDNGRHCYDYIFGRKGPCEFCEAHNVLKTGKPHHWECTGPDGLSIIDVYDFPFTDTDGSPLILEMDIDITEQKRAEEVLRESEDKFRHVFDYSVIGKSITSPLSGKMQVNKALCEMLGYSREELKVKKWQEITHPDDIEDSQKAVDSILSGQKDSVQFFKRYIHKNGSVVWADVSTSLRRDNKGKPLYLMTSVVNITERKLVEEALRDSEVKFRTLFENMAAGTCIDEIVYEAGMPVDYRILDVNSSWEKITGISRSQAVGSLATQLYALEKPSFFDIYAKVAETGEPVSFESYFPPIGKHLHITASCPARGRFSTVVTDMTERKRAEEALRTSEERFRLVVENAPFGYYRVGKDGLWQHVNPVWERMHEYSLKDVIGKSFEITQTKEDVEKARQYVKRALAGETIAGEFSRITKQGTVKYHSFNIQPVRRGNEIVAIEGFISDITEQMQARENLQKERTLLRTLIDHIPDPVYLKDTNGKFIACNKALLKFWGIKNDCEMIGKTDYDFFDNSRAKEYFDEEQIVIQTKRPLINREGQYPDKAGHLHSFLVTKLPLRDSRGNVTGIVGINRDITEHRIAEKKLLEDQKQLKKLALQLALTEERERRRIARDLHDQVNQSLALAKIKLDTMLASEKSVPLTETLRETSNAIEKAIQNTRSLTFDLSYPILYDMGFEAAVEEWLQEQVQKKHGIKTEFLDDGPTKPLDDDVRALLFRNVRELLINIIKHARADKIIVSVAKTDDSIKVTVEDNGVGLNADEITASRKGGLGLFSIRESIGELGGSFEIESKPGAGCKVTMTAPLKSKSRGKEG